MKNNIAEGCEYSLENFENPGIFFVCVVIKEKMGSTGIGITLVLIPIKV